MGGGARKGEKEVVGWLGITGTPGTGKLTIGKRLAGLLNLPLLELNSLALGIRDAGANKLQGDVEVDLKELRRRTKEAMKAKKAGIVIGHLLPSILRKGELDLVVVLRCHPRELRRRLEARGYTEEKIKENLGAEVLGVISVEALESFGEGAVMEVDTSGGDPQALAKSIATHYINGGRGQGLRIDWLSCVKGPEELEEYFPAR